MTRKPHRESSRCGFCVGFRVYFKRMKLLVIVPAYNEQESILATVHDICTNAAFADVLVINDCSKDDTEKILREHDINHITLPINLGLSGGIQTGYRYAWINGYDYAIQFDGDGQHQAIYIKSLLDKIQQGFDIVIGSRFVDQPKDKSMRMIGSRIITKLIKWFTGMTINDPTSGMRLINRKMIYDFAYNMNRHPEPETLVYELRHGAKIAEVQVTVKERTGGSSIYSSWFNSAKYMFYRIISILFLSY